MKKLISKEMQNIIKLLRDVSAKTELSVEAQRAAMKQMSSMAKLPKDVKYEAVNAGGVFGEWISVPESSQEYVILDLHGGYYIVGEMFIERVFASILARASKCRVLVIDYRLAPENPFPAALEDAVKAYKWLINEEGINPQNIIIAGTSAGGGLTLACLLKLRDNMDPLPAAAVSLCPYGDLTLSGNTYKTNADLDWISYEASKFNTPLYCGEEDPKNPYVSPIFGDFNKLPPLFIQVGSHEVLYDDAIRLGERAKAAGVDVMVDVWEGMFHGFQMFYDFGPEAKAAIKRMSEFTDKFFK